jgi:hypothetical protein
MTSLEEKKRSLISIFILAQVCGLSDELKDSHQDKAEWVKTLVAFFIFFRSHIKYFAKRQLSGTIIRGTLKTPNSQLVTPISTKLQRPDGCD